MPIAREEGFEPSQYGFGDRLTQPTLSSVLQYKSTYILTAEDQGLEPRNAFTSTCFQDKLLIQPDAFLTVGEKGIEPPPVLDDYRFTVCADLSQYSALSR